MSIVKFTTSTFVFLIYCLPAFLSAGLCDPVIAGVSYQAPVVSDCLASDSTQTKECPSPFLSIAYGLKLKKKSYSQAKGQHKYLPANILRDAELFSRQICKSN